MQISTAYPTDTMKASTAIIILSAGFAAAADFSRVLGPVALLSGVANALPKQSSPPVQDSCKSDSDCGGCGGSTDFVALLDKARADEFATKMTCNVCELVYQLARFNLRKMKPIDPVDRTGHLMCVDHAPKGTDLKERAERQKKKHDGAENKDTLGAASRAWRFIPIPLGPGAALTALSQLWPSRAG
ncbi:hypothetical protein O9K51_02148 [Purpureocillium lavendulum]|uniref:Uncharacterized protein n=1 Tax=Purpureocillium lavendulum TaxID=1247861 RepID=A0AB34FZA3_9HYPO|nr:hypothetical protein O9K51_02148 [Purpureocillium lavendulum]